MPGKKNYGITYNKREELEIDVDTDLAGDKRVQQLKLSLYSLVELYYELVSC